MDAFSPKGSKEKKKTGKAEQQLAIKKAKWYVNLDARLESIQELPLIHQDENNNEGTVAGPIMPIKATLVTNNKKAFTADWSLKSDPNNLDVNLQTSCLPASLEKADTIEEDTKAKERFFKNRLKLPDISGDKHTITVSKKKLHTRGGRDILKVEVETWRRIWFTIFWTDDQQLPLINDVARAITSAYAEAKIDMVHVPATTKLDYNHATVAILRSPSPLEDFVKAMHGGQHPALQRKPFHLQVVMVKECAEIKRVDIKSKFGPYDFPNFKVEDENAEVMKVIGIKIKVPKEYHLLTDDVIQQVKKLRNDYWFKKTIKSLKVQIQGETNPRIENPEYIVKRNNPNEFTFELLANFEYISEALAEGKTVDLEFGVEVYDTNFAGVNDGNKIVIATHETQANNPQLPQSPETLAKVLIHEIGHAVGLVPDTINSFKHPDHYSGHGGTGPHCKHNAALNQYGIYRYGNAGKMCVMYHQVHDQAGPEFCDNCIKYLKFTKLRNNDLKFGDLPNWKKPWEFTS